MNKVSQIKESRMCSIEYRENRDTNSISGYAAVFNTLSQDLGGFKEIIAPDAFSSVKNDDVRALFNHDPTFILGRTSAETLLLDVDNIGLYYTIFVPETQYGRDLMKSIDRGDISQSSFAFQVDKDEWQENREGLFIRTITKFKKLFDISPVTYPAYLDTTVAKRSLQDFRLTSQHATLCRDKLRIHLIKQNLKRNMKK